MAYRSTKHGKPVRARSLPGYGFHWFGRDDHGVSIWGGQVGALTWGGRIIGASGILCLTAAAVCLIFGVERAPMVLGSLGALHSAIGAVMLRERRRIERLATVEEATRELGFASEDIREMVDRKGIKPRMIINGEPYYDPTDLGDAATLLRTAPAPKEDSLLRAAVTSTAESAHLLHAADHGDMRESKSENPESEELLPIRQDVSGA